MVRINMPEPKGKFLLKKVGTRPLYYLESGVANIGTPDEHGYVNWTQYGKEAYGFKTAKTARRMQQKLKEEYGADSRVISRDGRMI